MARPIAYPERDGRSWRCDGCGSHGRAVSATDGHRIAAEVVAAHVGECTPAAPDPEDMVTMHDELPDRCCGCVGAQCCHCGESPCPAPATPPQR